MSQNCTFVIYIAYQEDEVEDGPTASVQMWILSVLYIAAAVMGVFTFFAIIVKQGLYQTKLLLAYYIFVGVLLTMRITTFMILFADEASGNKTLCAQPWSTTILSQVPTYMQIYAGLCQLFIVMQIYSVWKIAYFGETPGNAANQPLQSKSYLK